MDSSLLGILPCAFLLAGGYVLLRRRYFLPQYRWRLVVLLDGMCTAGYVWVGHSQFQVLSFVAFTAVMGAISAGLLWFEYRLPTRGRPGPRSIEDTFG